MYTIDKYIKDTIVLTNSLVIKLSDNAFKINQGIYLTYGETPSEDKRDWKYYKNISGEKHFTNTEVYIYVTEIDQTLELTKELLETHTHTRNNLMLHTEVYKELVSNYPTEIDYIKGCIYPVDIDEAINAKDGTILNYNKTLVQDNESSIMRELEDNIVGFLARWHVSEYNITDELYMAGMLGVLYSTLPSTIINIRSERIYTAEAHAFHVEHFFRSRLDIWDEVKILNNETIFWLYQNLNYLMINVGKNSTLETILTKIFEANNVGVGGYILENQDPEFNIKSNTDYKESASIIKENRFKIVPLNNAYDSSVNDLDIESTVNLELFNTIDLDTEIDDSIVQSTIEDVKKKIATTNVVDQNSKILELSTSRVFKMYGNDVFLATMDHWLYLANSGVYSNRTSFVDPNTKIAYNLTPMEGLYLFYYMLTEIAGIPNILVNEVNYTKVINNNITLSGLVENLYNPTSTTIVGEVIKSKIPLAPTNINNSTTMSLYLSELKDLYLTTWLLDSNCNNATISANIKHMSRRMKKSGSVKLKATGLRTTFKQLLVEAGVTINMNSQYNKVDTIYELYKTFMGENLDEYQDINESLEIYTKLLLKLTSYTTQVVKGVDDSKTLYAHHNNLQAFHAEQGMINVTEARIVSPYETVHQLVVGTANNYVDDIVGLLLNRAPTMRFVDNPHVILDNEQVEGIEGSMRPVMYAEILDDMYNEQPLEVSGNVNDHIGDIKAVVQEEPSYLERKEDLGDPVIYGEATSEDEELIVDLTSPTLTVEIED